jgi:hypothetical protein
MKDILVYCPSRDKPKFLEDTLEKLYSSASDVNNFDILCHVDIDQISMYDSVIKKYPNVIWQHLEHCSTSWFNMVKSYHEYIDTHDYYFHWNITDDSVKNDLNKNWDNNIIKRKKTFNDDLFVLYTNCTFWQREMKIHEQCYYITHSDFYNGRIILYKNEMLPIWTYKFVKYIWDIIKTGNYSSSRELLTSSIIYKLLKEYNVNRHVSVDINYTHVDRIPEAPDKSHLIKNNNGLTRDEAYMELVRNNFKEIMPTVQNMYYYIKQFNKNI